MSVCRERLQTPRSVRFRKHGAPVDEGYIHARLRATERDHMQRQAPSITYSQSQCMWEPHSVPWNTEQASAAGVSPQAGHGGGGGVVLPLQWCSKLVHDAVGMVDRHRAVLAQSLPLEGGAEGTHLILLTFLFLGKLHKHLFQS